MSVFIDTNVAVYAVDVDEPAKRAVADPLLFEAQRHGRLVISTQVLQETFNVLTRKKKLSPRAALDYVQSLAEARVIGTNAEFVLRGLSLSIQSRLSVWNGLIVQAALDGGCSRLYSEDLQHGGRFGELEIVNPFNSAVHEAVPAYATQPPKRRSRRRA
jgi:predicted nucleic acid-binding protein